MVKEKIFKGFLVLNWKTGKVRLLKSKMIELSPFEIRVPYNIKVTLPEFKDVPMNIDVQLPVIDTSDIKM